MTNREKFRNVFGVEFEDFNVDDLQMPYAKQKKYKAWLESWRFPVEGREATPVFVCASSKIEAREKAKKALGERYRTFSGGAPVFKLNIVQISGKEEE